MKNSSRALDEPDSSSASGSSGLPRSLRTRRLTVPAQHNQLAKLALFVATAALEVGFDEAQVNRIELAVDEACSNVIDHAYQGEPGDIQLDVQIDVHKQLVIVIIDHGQPFNPQQVPDFAPCTSLDDLKIGGLGIHLMKQAMDDVCYEFNVPDVGNRLTMSKRL